MKNFSGKILFLDRSDINTDEIIPAKYLTELTKEALKPYCLEDLNIPGFDPKKDIAGKSVVITDGVKNGVVLSARNIPGVVTTPANILSVYDLVNAKTLVIDKAALATIEEVYA